MCISAYLIQNKKLLHAHSFHTKIAQITYANSHQVVRESCDYIYLNIFNYDKLQLLWSHGVITDTI